MGSHREPEAFCKRRSAHEHILKIRKDAHKKGEGLLSVERILRVCALLYRASGSPEVAEIYRKEAESIDLTPVQPFINA